MLSNNDGCVVARSDEAKALGIEEGTPWFQAKTFFERHGVQVYSSNYELYGDMSRRVMDALARFGDEAEPGHGQGRPVPRGSRRAGRANLGHASRKEVARLHHALG